MGALTAMVRALHEKLDQLEEGAACPGDWVRLHAAVMRAAIAAREQVAGTAPTPALCELVDELRYIKLCAEIHLSAE